MQSNPRPARRPDNSPEVTGLTKDCGFGDDAGWRTNGDGKARTVAGSEEPSGETQHGPKMTKAPTRHTPAEKISRDDLAHCVTWRRARRELPSERDLENVARVLEACGNYRLLRRLRPRVIEPHNSEGLTRRAIFLDVETTGLDSSNDAIVELAMLPFDYGIDGRIVAIGEPFVGLRDPGCTIPPDISDLTGITNQMVAGTSIDPEEVRKILAPASLVIAHNAAFDRPFCERQWPEFATKAWACSLKEINWAAEGFEGARLCHIAAGYGFFFDGHRAADDCYAGVEILTRELPVSGRPVFAALLDSARLPRIRVWAEGAPYVLRTVLKKRGYRWSDAHEGRRGAWYADVAQDLFEAELEFLRREIYRRDNIAIRHQCVTAFDRYSIRW